MQYKCPHCNMIIDHINYSESINHWGSGYFEEDSLPSNENINFEESNCENNGDIEYTCPHCENPLYLEDIIVIKNENGKKKKKRKYLKMKIKKE